MNGSNAELIRRFRETSPSRIRLCSVVKAELIYGAFKSDRAAETHRKLQRFFGPLKSLPFDDACAEQAGLLRAELQRRGTPLGPHDLLIAATALAFGATLVSHNRAEFSRVPALRLEDWELTG